METSSSFLKTFFCALLGWTGICGPNQPAEEPARAEKSRPDTAVVEKAVRPNSRAPEQEKPSPKPSEKQTHYLAFGDIHCSADMGWAYYLNKRLEGQLHRACRKDQTIGYDNGHPENNTLRQYEHLLGEAYNEYIRQHGLKGIILFLGTNDCQAPYQDSLAQTTENLRHLVEGLKKWCHKKDLEPFPRFYLVVPPPMAADAEQKPRFKGGQACLEKLKKRYLKVARENGYPTHGPPQAPNYMRFIDLLQFMKPFTSKCRVGGYSYTMGCYEEMAKYIRTRME